MTTLSDMPMITIEQKNRFREAALKVEAERDEAKRMLASACEYLSHVSVLVGGEEEEDPQTIVEMVEGAVAGRVELREERDQLAAHVDRMTDVFKRLHLKSPSPIEVLQAYSYVMREAPAASLARRDARMKAEALEEIKPMLGNVLDHIQAKRMAAEYRKQAEVEA
ncbi:hypothetical protein ACFO0O_00520 [Cobetia amphilecti]|uniref:Uncharacterized protein n=1 Tax=Cobetia amphilecti TaxID=1055104 RepID=A0ABT6UTM1_9GAMM|nr:hypothetical protein [Cobetia amphilecti]MDI5886059.1 hypothetical protein [Cobetia amphilecti]